MEPQDLVFVVPHKVTPQLIKPLAHPFHSTGALGKRIGHAQHKAHETPDTPIKSRNRKRLPFSAPNAANSGLARPLYSLSQSEISCLSTPIAAKRPQFTTFSTTPLNLDRSYESDEISPCTPVVELKRNKPAHTFHLESTTPFAETQNSKKYRSPLGESPIHTHKRQHTGDIMMGSPTDSNSEPEMNIQQNENNILKLFRSDSLNSEIENYIPDNPFRKIYEEIPSSFGVTKSRPLASHSNENIAESAKKLPPSLIPVATRKLSRKAKFPSIPCKLKYEEFTLPNNPLIQTNNDFSFAQHDMSQLSISDLQPNPIPCFKERRLSISDTYHIPYYVLFSNQVLFFSQILACFP